MKHPILIILFFSLLASCELGGGPGGADPQAPEVAILSPTMVSETSLQLNWTVVSPAGAQSIAVELSEDSEMEHITQYVDVGDISSDHVLLSNLKGATRYYYRISFVADGISIYRSDIASAETLYQLDNIELTTEDSYTLSGKLAYLESISGSRPGIIMMHEFGVWVNPWIGSELMQQLVAEGYVCLTFFFRGHGSSDPVDDLMDLVNDKSLLANDLKASVDFMKELELVTPDELGLMGGSMGAIMALAGNGYQEVKTSVALSPTRDGVFVIFPEMTLSSAYYLVGEQDVHTDILGGDFPAETQTLYDMTEEPRKLDIIEGTADHGTSLLSRAALNTSIKEWIMERLPVK